MKKNRTGLVHNLRYLCLVGIIALGLVTVVGSGGGDGDSDSDTATDSTPPEVSSTSPADSATGVAVDTTVTATFSEEMDSSTITASTFTVSDGSTNIAGTVNYSAKTATFTATDAFNKNIAYTATITTGAKDAAGNALESDYTWSFTTIATTTYNSGASFGDLLTYTIDTSVSPMTYSYEIIESDFGLTNDTGSGTLTLNQDGTYTPSNDPGAGVILLPNTLIVGAADVVVNSANTTMLFAGVPALTTNYTASEIAGAYNYITFSCDDPLSAGVCTAGYKSYYGTFKIKDDGTWSSCDEGNIDDQQTNPCNATMNGTWTDQGNGRIRAVTGGNEIAKLMLLPSSSGGKVIIGDLKDLPSVQGPGILVGVKKQDITNEDLGGKYQFNDDDGGYGDVTVNNANNSYSGQECDASNTCTNITGNFTRNDPWNGWLNDTNTLILILPSDGVFFQMDNLNNNWITIGGQIP